MHNNPEEIEVGLMPLRDDQVADAAEACAPDEPLAPLTAKQIKLAYQMMLPGMVYRLFLYLYGEVDRQKAEDAYEVVSANDTIYDQIMTQRVAPMRALYELLIKREFIEREELGDEANAHLDRRDELQERLQAMSEPEALTYVVSAEVNVKAEPGSYNPATLHWGPRNEMDKHGELQRTWDKIKLNGDIPRGVHSPYSLLYEPNKLGE